MLCCRLQVGRALFDLQRSGFGSSVALLSVAAVQLDCGAPQQSVPTCVQNSCSLQFPMAPTVYECPVMCVLCDT